MPKKLIILFAAEIVAVAVLRLLHILRRDRMYLPRSSKVDRINDHRVYHNPPGRAKPLDEDALREHAIEGWTPRYKGGKIRITPDDSPGA